MATTHKKKKSSPAGSSRAVDAQLARYRSMRDFDVTAEPRGGLGKGAMKGTKPEEPTLPFVIQKHAATRLHYDFRLGWRGVLKSWAVTKGPSYYPGDKRLAVQVEDHPVEYGGFEGIIPKGQYGGGTVMVWDQGTWEPHGDVDAGLAKGSLKFTLHGKKLLGNWTLVRMGGKAAEEKKSNWLLIKERDGKEYAAEDLPITETDPNSAVTGRDLEAISENQDHVWDSRSGLRTTSSSSAASRSGKNPQSGRKQPQIDPAHSEKKPAVLSFNLELEAAPKETLPTFIQPQLAFQVRDAPDGSEWIHELKLDGYRVQARISRKRVGQAASVSLLTRSGLDWTHRMTQIAEAVADLPVQTAVLDGEVVVFDEEGKTNFARLQAAFQEGKKQPLTYVVFDLLHLNGHGLREWPLEQRKKVLERLFSEISDQDGSSSILQYCEHFSVSGKDIFKKACELGAEGIISKKRSAPYASGRSRNWLKIKCIHKQEFVIGGFTLPSKGGAGLGALLLGYYRDSDLVYAGRTGTGFTQKVQQSLRSKLEKVSRSGTPFATIPAAAARDVRWVQPRYVCEVQFSTWTADNLVRQASYKGLREDKPAAEVRQEMPEDLPPKEDAPSRQGTSKKVGTRSSAPRSRLSKATARAPQNRQSSTSTKDAFPISLTHPDKQVDSESKLTKRELAEYFWAVREYMLPHILDRPLSIVRCPQGSMKPCFYQKRAIGNLPDGIEGVDVRERKSGKLQTYLTLSSPLGLAGLAQLGVLEIHPWGSSNADIEKPDRLIFDLDPDEAIGWSTLAQCAREVRTLLQQCGLKSFLKTTGGKGLHVIAPIEPKHEWPAIKAFALGIANAIETWNPDLYLTRMTKAARKGKIYIDYLRNERGATSIAPYSPRARQGAPVAVPLRWKELDAGKPRFLVADFLKWKTRLQRDPWKDLIKTHQSIPEEILNRFPEDQANSSRRSRRAG